MLFRPRYKLLPLVLILFIVAVLLRRLHGDSYDEFGSLSLDNVDILDNGPVTDPDMPAVAGPLEPPLGAQPPPQKPLNKEKPESIQDEKDAPKIQPPSALDEEVPKKEPISGKRKESPESDVPKEKPAADDPSRSGNAKPTPAYTKRPGGVPTPADANKVKSFDQSRKLPPGVVEKDPPVDPAYYNRIKSVSTPDKKYFKVKMGKYASYNPNILPHPYIADQWVVIAQYERHDGKDGSFQQLGCNAAFNSDGTLLECVIPPQLVLYQSTNHKGPDDDKVPDPWVSKCEGNLGWLTFNVGPHDARAFYGPEFPYTTYGINSETICFSQWIQDLRGLYEKWDDKPIERYATGTEIMRPPPRGLVEKNYFVFWDDKDVAYVHYNSSPTRMFAKLDANGTLGEDLGLAVAEHDNKCLDKFMPPVGPELESIHQATNSLAVTMCKRADPSCKATADNTYIISIFHWKSYFYMHGAYEPHVLVFKQAAPFELYGVTKKALWIEGRREMNELTSGNIWRNFDPGALPKNHTEMVYVTSITWKEHGMKYHGFMDDVMFLGFGVEDSHSGAIDVRPEDILKDIGLCSDV